MPKTQQQIDIENDVRRIAYLQGRIREMRISIRNMLDESDEAKDRMQKNHAFADNHRYVAGNFTIFENDGKVEVDEINLHPVTDVSMEGYKHG